MSGSAISLGTRQSLFVLFFLSVALGIFELTHKHGGQRVSGEDNRAVRPATPQERREAIATVSGQLYAFRQNDYQKAEYYQSERFQEYHQTPLDFKRMISGRYPVLADFKAIKFGKAVNDRRFRMLTLDAFVVGRNNQVFDGTYYLMLENGSYRVAGVVEHSSTYHAYRHS